MLQIQCTKNETADLATFTEEILNGKLHFLFSDLLRITNTRNSSSEVHNPNLLLFIGFREYDCNENDTFLLYLVQEQKNFHLLVLLVLFCFFYLLFLELKSGEQIQLFSLDLK